MSRRSALIDELRRVRRRTHELVGAVAEDVLLAQHHPLMGPMMWDLGHVAAFEHLWLVSVLDGDVPPQGEMGLDRIYNPFENPRAVRGELALPGKAATFAQMASVREQSLARLVDAALDASPLTQDGFIWAMVAQHEAWHQETMLVAASTREDGVYSPDHPVRPLPDPHPVHDDERVRVPSGRYLLGTNDRARAYDNERPQHPVELAAFDIDRFPVSNRRYLRFVRDTGWRPPLHWRRDGDGWAVVRFGQVSALDPREPVCHVSWDDALAFARWEGRRLAREAEWEVAALWDPRARGLRRFPWGDNWEEDRCNVDHLALAPSRLGSYPQGESVMGMAHALGDVWEWVDDALAPYPGFEAFPYDEFTVPFFGSNRVLRGGSWATGRSLVRGSLRNWDLADRRQIFVGFRCANDA